MLTLEIKQLEKQAKRAAYRLSADPDDVFQEAALLTLELHQAGKPAFHPKYMALRAARRVLQKQRGIRYTKVNGRPTMVVTELAGEEGETHLNNAIHIPDDEDRSKRERLRMELLVTARRILDLPTRRVFHGIMRGESRATIAANLGISQAKAASTRENIRQKFRRHRQGANCRRKGAHGFSLDTEITIEGETKTGRQWLELSPISITGVRKRYAKGKRGAELFAPSGFNPRKG